MEFGLRMLPALGRAGRLVRASGFTSKVHARADGQGRTLLATS